MNILIVDDEETNIKLINFYIKTYFESISHTTYSLSIASNGLEALGYCMIRSYDLIFLDVKMPKLDGIKFLNILRKNQTITKPLICMVTALGEEKYKHLFKLLGANSFIIKPFKKTNVIEILQQIKPLSLEPKSKENADDHNFDSFDEFDEFDEHDTSQKKTLIDTNTREKVSASDFLKDYPKIDYILEDLEDIDELLQELIDNLDISNFEKYTEEIGRTLLKYERFLNTFICFTDISKAIHALDSHIRFIDLENYDLLKGNYLVELIRATLEDISVWKEHVFIQQNVNDIYYINYSVLSNCQQLEKLIHRS